MNTMEHISGNGCCLYEMDKSKRDECFTNHFTNGGQGTTTTADVNVESDLIEESSEETMLNSCLMESVCSQVGKMALKQKRIMINIDGVEYLLESEETQTDMTDGTRLRTTYNHRVTEVKAKDDSEILLSIGDYLKTIDGVKVSDIHINTLLNGKDFTNECNWVFHSISGNGEIVLNVVNTRRHSSDLEEDGFFDYITLVSKAKNYQIDETSWKSKFCYIENVCYKKFLRETAEGGLSFEKNTEKEMLEVNSPFLFKVHFFNCQQLGKNVELLSCIAFEDSSSKKCLKAKSRKNVTFSKRAGILKDNRGCLSQDPCIFIYKRENESFTFESLNSRGCYLFANGENLVLKEINPDIRNVYDLSNAQFKLHSKVKLDRASH